MIASVRGEVLSVGLDHAVVEVGGVGLAVQATPATLAGLRRGEQARLATALVVREDSLTLFGFADAEEREVFVRLLSVSGVGPKVALAIVSASAPAELRRAIAREDAARFQAVPGVGRKTAERIVLELKESLAVAEAGAEDTSAGTHAIARDALVELGYSLAEAEAVLSRTDPELPPEERVRLALREAA